MSVEEKDWFWGGTAQQVQEHREVAVRGSVPAGMVLTDQVETAIDDAYWADPEHRSAGLLKWELRSGARVLDLTTVSALENELCGRTELRLPTGGKGCWLRRKGYSALAYDPALLRLDEDDRKAGRMVPTRLVPSLETCLLVVGGQDLRLIETWEGTLAGPDDLESVEFRPIEEGGEGIPHVQP